jgi:adenosylcobinamide kinase/adenosylcobinamide-phosphate guanylyltransferase
MLTLILGGARSGKSDLAVRLAAAKPGGVLFVATMAPGDDELRARVAAHRASRPVAWRTVEATIDVPQALASAGAGEIIVIDCVTLWVSNLLLDSTTDIDDIPPGDAALAAERVLRALDAMLDAVATFDGDVIVVSNEVGLGVVPRYPLGRLFRDAIGAANSAIAARADRVYYLVAGLALELKALGALPLDAFGEAPRHDPDR